VKPWQPFQKKAVPIPVSPDPYRVDEDKAKEL
jgi:hypothetical protein